MNRTSVIVLLLTLCLVLLCGCSESAAPVTEPTQVTEERLPVAQVQLPEIYNIPVKEALLERHWLLTGQPDLLITDQLPEEIAVPVVLVGTLQSPIPQVYTVQYDWDALPAQQAAMLAQLPYQGDLNRDGVITYAIIAPTGSSYKDACQEAMTQLSSAPQLLNSQTCKDDMSVAQQVAGRILTSYGKDLDVLLCGSEHLSIGAADAVKDAGRVINQDLILLTVGQDIPHYSGTVYPDSAQMIQAIVACAETRQPETLIPLCTHIKE